MRWCRRVILLVVLAAGADCGGGHRFGPVVLDAPDVPAESPDLLASDEAPVRPDYGPTIQPTYTPEIEDIVHFCLLETSCHWESPSREALSTCIESMQFGLTYPSTRSPYRVDKVSPSVLSVAMANERFACAKKSSDCYQYMTCRSRGYDETYCREHPRDSCDGDVLVRCAYRRTEHYLDTSNVWEDWLNFPVVVDCADVGGTCVTDPRADGFLHWDCGGEDEEYCRTHDEPWCEDLVEYECDLLIEKYTVGMCTNGETCPSLSSEWDYSLACSGNAAILCSPEWSQGPPPAAILDVCSSDRGCVEDPAKGADNVGGEPHCGAATCSGLTVSCRGNTAVMCQEVSDMLDTVTVDSPYAMPQILESERREYEYDCSKTGATCNPRYIPPCRHPRGNCEVGELEGAPLCDGNAVVPCIRGNWTRVDCGTIGKTCRDGCCI